MNCTKCGAVLAPGARVCSACGTPVQAQPQMGYQQPGYQQPMGYQQAGYQQGGYQQPMYVQVAKGEPSMVSRIVAAVFGLLFAISVFLPFYANDGESASLFKGMKEVGSAATIWMLLFFIFGGLVILFAFMKVPAGAITIAAISMLYGIIWMVAGSAVEGAIRGSGVHTSIGYYMLVISPIGMLVGGIMMASSRKKAV